MKNMYGSTEKKIRFYRHMAGMAMVAVCLLFCPAITASAQEAPEQEASTQEAWTENENPLETYRVLFISSYSYTWPTVPLQMQGIQSALDENVTLDVEFMDTKVLSPEIAEEELLERLSFKKEHMAAYDAVITGDDAALVFAMDHRKELFDGIPVVFEGINNVEYAEQISEDPLITGVIEKFSYPDNLDFALRIQPGAKRILAIVDDTVTGIGEQQQFFAQREAYSDLSFEVINGSALTRQEFISAVSEVGDDTILLYLILSEDAEGNIYTNEQVCQILKNCARVPVYRFVQAGIGEGVLGGNIVLHEESGAIAGRMVMKMLNGAEPSSVAMQSESPNSFYLDQEVLERFSISKSLIPEGSVIIHQKPGFWEMHGTVFLITLGTALVLMILAVLVVRSVYERRRREEVVEKNRQLAGAAMAAEKANGAKSKFLAQMSHEIRTPMNAIIGLASIAKTETDQPDRIKEYLSKIESSSRLLLGIINDILDMSAIERGKMKLDKAPFDFKKQISGIVNMFYQQTKQKRIEFEAHMNGVTEEMLVGDELRINQILMNLLSNAVKFTPVGGKIDLNVTQTSCSQDKVYMRFVVKDNGCGMTEDMLGRLFSPFEQQDASTACKHGGSGLGLSITKNLVEMMGGTIRAESTLNEGSTFIADLPFGRCEQKALLKTGFEKIRAMIVDDDEEACRYCGMILERLGVRHDYVTEGEAALEALGEAEEQGDPYSLCIVDWKMPKMNGVEVTRQIRSVFGEDSVVIIASAYDLNEIEEEGKMAGASYFMKKPMFQSSLFNILRRIVGRPVQEEESAGKAYDFSGRQILLAEDMELNREVAVRMLNRVGVEVSCAENGKIALECYEQAPDGFFDCILLDVNMPEMDGYETVAAIRRSTKPDAVTVPVFAMTANAFAEDVQTEIDAGMNGHIAKPVEADILYKILQEVFRKS